MNDFQWFFVIGILLGTLLGLIITFFILEYHRRKHIKEK